jgi:cell division protein FtsZ
MAMTSIALPTIAIDTDSKSLLESRATTKLDIGSNHTNSLGTGGDINLGKLSAEDDIEMIRSLFSETDLAIFVVGLGGGTGTGAVPVVLGAAHDAGAMTLCFATLPFEFEGERRKTNAEKAVAVIRETTDSMAVISNDKLAELVGEAGVAETYERTDEILGAGVFAIAKLIAEPEYINVDFVELRRMIANGGACSFGYGQGDGKDKAVNAVNSLFGNSLADGGAVTNAKSLLVSILGGKDLTVTELRQIRDGVSSKVQADCRISLGTVIDDNWAGRVAIAMIASEQPIVRHAIVHEQPVSTRDHAATAKSPRGTKKHKMGQTQLIFESSSKGRFKDAVPTILDGEDVDIPTYLRRGIIVEK